MKVQGQTKDSLEVVAAANTFIKAFTGFNWEVFRNSFSKDATTFIHPGKKGNAEPAKKEIEDTWLQLFPEFIDSTKKFKMDISPRNMLVQLYGKTAVVTFHLGDENKYLSRRTFIFIKEGVDWKIVHLHASTLLKANNN